MQGWLAASVLLFLNFDAASARTIQADILDERVLACGVNVTGSGSIAVQPFLDSVEPITGSVELAVEAMSTTGRNTTVQRSSLDAMPALRIGAAHTLDIQLTIRADNQIICVLEERVELGTRSI